MYKSLQVVSAVRVIDKLWNDVWGGPTVRQACVQLTLCLASTVYSRDEVPQQEDGDGRGHKDGGCLCFVRFVCFVRRLGDPLLIVLLSFIGGSCSHSLAR